MYIYILKLQNNKYYVGKTKNPKKRLVEHYNGYGSAWTNKYRPIKVLELISNSDDYDEEKYTIEYMKKFGIENVRGGTFTTIHLPKFQTDYLEKVINSTSNKCYICGKKGHFAKECYYKNHDKKDDDEEESDHDYDSGDEEYDEEDSDSESENESESESENECESDSVSDSESDSYYNKLYDEECT